MKILCVIDSLGSGGAQRQLVSLAKGFKEKGHEVSFLVYHPQDFYKKELEEAGINITFIIEPNYAKRLFKMRKFIRAGKYDSVLSFLEAANFIATVSGLPYRKWKLVVGERSANPNIMKSFKLRFYRWFHVFADYVVANSHANLDIVRKINPILSSKKCKVIYNAVPATIPNIVYKEFSKDKPLEIVVGASHRYIKNARLMIHAYMLLKDEDKERIKIKWYGDNVTEPYFDGSYKEVVEMIRTNKLYEKISFYPASNNFMEVMKRSDIVGLFSSYEGFPNTICEAMAIGKPVICSDVADIPLIISEHSKQIFKINDVWALKRTFEFYLHLSPKEYENIAISNLSIAKKHFNPDNIVKQYLNTLS